MYPPTSKADAAKLVDKALATAMHATRCAAHSSLKSLTPGGLVFHRDMYFDIPLTAEILTLQEARQQAIDKRLLAANAKRLHHEFQVGELVKKRRQLKANDKLRSTFTGPFRIIRVHTNGTVTVRLNDHVEERLNIRRLEPYKEPH
jgi:hypothetical protein